MAGRQKPRQAPDGQPAPRPRDADGTTKSRVSEVQDPIIAGDAGGKAAVDAGEVSVDDAGQVKPKKKTSTCSTSTNSRTIAVVVGRSFLPWR